MCLVFCVARRLVFQLTLTFQNSLAGQHPLRERHIVFVIFIIGAIHVHFGVAIPLGVTGRPRFVLGLITHRHVSLESRHVIERLRSESTLVHQLLGHLTQSQPIT